MHNMIKTYEDAKEYLRIADNAYNAEAFAESAEIVKNLAYFAVKEGNSALTPSQKADITEQLKKAIGRFTFCPDECIWEDTCGLLDLFE